MTTPDKAAEWSKDGHELNWEGCIELFPQKAETMRRDNHDPKPHTSPMTDQVTRAELDAKLETIEARMDARIARIENAVSGFQEEAIKLRSELSSAKWWAIGTAIAVLAIFMATIQWGLQAQKEENARFSSYIRDDVKDINNDVGDIAKSVNEMRISIEKREYSPPARP